jgi:hypothetical protein
VVLSGDEWDREGVFLNAWPETMRWYLTSQLVNYEGKKMEAAIFRCFASTESNLNLPVCLC